MEHIKEKSALISIKIVDLIRDSLLQTRTAVDKSIHVGGAFSALHPMSALYYSGLMNYDVEHPTSLDQDMFVLSKGHAVAAMAAVYADLGYFDRKHLENSRGVHAVVKGHPGPIIPGVPVATGPLGHGISISNGFAFHQRDRKSNHKVFCMLGDGELQEGSCWEGILYASSACLSNLILIVDKNDGQSDITSQLLYPADYMAKAFEGFGFEVKEAFANDVPGMITGLKTLIDSDLPKPKVLIVQSNKGYGGYSVYTKNHKTTLTDEAVQVEDDLQLNHRKQLVEALNDFDPAVLRPLAADMHMEIVSEGDKITDVKRVFPAVRVKKAAVRDKRVAYDPADLIQLSPDKMYAAKEVLQTTAGVFAKNDNFYTIDADLSNASGLFDGTCISNKDHSLNVGIAEANMMCMAEALAVNGNHVQISTFAPFFDWRAMRRIAVGFQERQEVIADGGWLSDGCNVDITMVATAANLDTSVNGATHMANDDSLTFSNVAHLKIIDVSCPQLLKSVLRWTAEGNKGLVYVRTMRNKANVLYPADYVFEYGRGQYLAGGDQAAVVIVSSGHGVEEALAAQKLLTEQGINAAVIDMPSFDPELVQTLQEKGTPVVFAEQNNGYLFEQYLRYAGVHQLSLNLDILYHLNARSGSGEYQFIHSGTYEQLVEQLGLTAAHIASYIRHEVMPA